MAFIILLILIIFIFCVRANDSISRNYYRGIDEKEKAVADAFYKRYECTDDEWYDIDYKIQQADPQMVSTKEELQTIIGMKPPHEMVMWAYLAKHGKIPPKWEIQSYYGSNNFLSSFLGEVGLNVINDLHISRAQEARDARLKFLIWYDAELFKNGMSERLMFIASVSKKRGFENGKFTYVDTEPYYPLSEMKPIFECGDLNGAIVFWKPTMYYLPSHDKFRLCESLK